MPLWVGTILACLGLLFLVKILYVVCTGWSMPFTQGALFVPTHPVRIEAALDALPMEPEEVLVDLGCGDGRVLRAVRRKYRVSARGIDVNPLACAAARLRNLADRRVRILWGNFWDHDVSDADVVFCYLFPDVMERMAAKLAAELRPGARIASCNFPLPGWEPEAVLHPTSSVHGDPIYLYRVKAPGEDKAPSRTADAESRRTGNGRRS